MAMLPILTALNGRPGACQRCRDRGLGEQGDWCENLGSLGVVLSCDGFEGVLTRCFFVLFVLTRRQPLRVESV